MIVYLVAGVAVLALVINVLSVTGIEYYQLKKNKRLIKQLDVDHDQSKSLVVYFSRSGNTALMAYKISELKNADVHVLSAPDYKIGIRGWINSMMDARHVDA